MSVYGILIPIAPDAAALALETLERERDAGKLPAVPVRHRSVAPASREDLARVHSPAYVERLFSDGVTEELVRTYELVDSDGAYHRYDPDRAERPLEELFDRVLTTVAGSYECCRIALAEGSCFYLSGGMHHAKHDTGDGFCVVNDVVIAARRLQAEGHAKRIWIIDLDVHKGDGTAALTAEDESIRTLSIHMAEGWPLDRQQHLPDGSLHPSHIPSDVDIPIPEGDEDAYVPLLAAGLAELDTFERPDLAIVLYGADPYEKDELPSSGGIKLSLPQMLERDELAYRFLAERGIPRAYLKSGGYGIRAADPLTQFLRWYVTEEQNQ